MSGYGTIPRGCSRCGAEYLIGTQTAPWLCHPCITGGLPNTVPLAGAAPAAYAIGRVGVNVRAAGAVFEIVVRDGTQQVSLGPYTTCGAANVHAGWLAGIIRRAVGAQSGRS